MSIPRVHIPLVHKKASFEDIGQIVSPIQDVLMAAQIQLGLTLVHAQSLRSEQDEAQPESEQADLLINSIELFKEADDGLLKMRASLYTLESLLRNEEEVSQDSYQDCLSACLETILDEQIIGSLNGSCAELQEITPEINASWVGLIDDAATEIKSMPKTVGSAYSAEITNKASELKSRWNDAIERANRYC